MYMKVVPCIRAVILSYNTCCESLIYIIFRWSYMLLDVFCEHNFSSEYNIFLKSVIYVYFGN